MSASTFGGETAPNTEQKCFCVVCIDTSYSMDGAPIREVNKGLVQLVAELKTDLIAKNRVELCFITFDSDVTCELEPQLVATITQPPVLQARGSTKLVGGMRAALAKLEERKQYYKRTGQPYYRPFLLLITDGQPDSDQDIAGLNTQLQDGTQRNKFVFLPIGAGDVDAATMNQICQPTKALKLQGIKYVELFEWLSNTLMQVSTSGVDQQLTFAPVDPWSGGVFSQSRA